MYSKINIVSIGIKDLSSVLGNIDNLDIFSADIFEISPSVTVQDNILHDILSYHSSLLTLVVTDSLDASYNKLANKLHENNRPFILFYNKGSISDVKKINRDYIINFDFSERDRLIKFCGDIHNLINNYISNLDLSEPQDFLPVNLLSNIYNLIEDYKKED